MKKNLLVICLVSILFSLVGCSQRNNTNTDDSAPQDMDISSANGYFLSKRCDGIRPYGVITINDSVIISDMGENCLLEYDTQGNEIRRLGRLGNGNGEFIRPSGLTYCDERLYVVDTGNSRIQVFDMEYQYQTEYKLEEEFSESASDMFYTDIAVGKDGIITVLSNSVVEEKARVYTSRSNGYVQKTPFVLNGYTCCEADKVYCINTFELFENGSSFDAVVNNSSMYEFADNELHELFKFPYKYGPTDFAVDGDDVYVLSCVWARLDHFKINGSYVETIWEFESLSPESYLARISQGGFVITDGQNNVAYFLSYEGN